MLTLFPTALFCIALSMGTHLRVFEEFKQNKNEIVVPFGG
jgi:hypothetical protein